MNKVADNNSNYFNDVITSSAKLSNGNVIVAGKKNAIFLSKDNGMNWETKMAICYEGVVTLEKSKDKIYLHNTPSGIISESLDSGIYWKTQKRYLEDFKAAPISSLIDDQGNLNYLYIDSVFKKSTGIPYEYSFMKNNIDVDNYKSLTSNNISYSTDQFNVYSLNSKFQWSDNPLILFFDKSNNLVKKIKLDSMVVFKMEVIDTNNVKLLIGERKQITFDSANLFLPFYGNTKTKLIETKDGGKNWAMLDIWDSTLQRTLCNIKTMDGNSDLIVAYNINWLNSSYTDYNKNIYLLKIKDDKISVIYSDMIRIGQFRNLYFIDKLQNNYILGFERYFLKVDENFKVLDSIPLRNSQSFIQSVNLGNKLLLLSNNRGKFSYFQESPTNSVETEFDNIAPNTNLTQSTYIELYDILGRSIATFTSYEKLKAEIENYPPPHLIKWRDENGIFHFEKMR